MQLTKSSVFLLSLTVGTCWTGIGTHTPKQDVNSSFIDAVVHIMKLCYANRVNEVGITGDSSAILIEKLSSQQRVPITLLDNTTRRVHNRPASRKSRYPLQVFIVTAYTPVELKVIISQIKSSSWWNHMASFFILDMPIASTHGCSNAFKMLKTAWDLDLLHAKFICLHPTRGRLIFSYNPYTRYAPNPWQLKNIYTGKNGHPWTLFVQEYREDKRICVELDFDKTKDLGGYEIRSTVKNVIKSWYIIPNKTGMDAYGGFSAISARLLFRALNATPKLIYRTGPDGFFHDEGIPEDIAADMINGHSDIGLNVRYRPPYDNVTMTYPHFYSGLVIATQYRGYASQLSTLRSDIDSISLYGVYLIILITLIFFKFFQNETLPAAILSTIRIICNSSVPKLSDRQASRIYLSSLFVFSITIQVIYQGVLVAMLMKQEPLPNVNTKQDVVDFGLTIYGYKLYAHAFNETALRKHFVELEDFNCTHYVLANSSAACVRDQTFLLPEAVQNNLHCSGESIVNISSIYVIRPNWPLEDRLNRILAALTEADIIWHDCFEEYNNVIHRFEFNQKLKKKEMYKVMTLNDLPFTFVILAIGLGCATLSFIVEIAFI